MSYIALDRSKAVANMIAQLNADAIALQAEASRVLAMINAITAGGATPANLETVAFGVSTGDGANVYSTVHDTIYLNTQAMNSAILGSMDNG